MKTILILIIVLLLVSIVIFIYNSDMWYISFILSSIATIMSFFVDTSDILM